jgi:hypothetical protein
MARARQNAAVLPSGASRPVVDDGNTCQNHALLEDLDTNLLTGASLGRGSYEVIMTIHSFLAPYNFRPREIIRLSNAGLIILLGDCIS